MKDGYVDLAVGDDIKEIARQYAYARAAIQDLEQARTDAQMGLVDEAEVENLRREVIDNLREVVSRSVRASGVLDVIQRKVERFLKER